MIARSTPPGSLNSAGFSKKRKSLEEHSKGEKTRFSPDLAQSFSPPFPASSQKNSAARRWRQEGGELSSSRGGRRRRRRRRGRRNAVGRLLGHPSTNSGSLRKCMKRDMKCTSSDVLASGQADNQLIEACGCIFIIYYRLPDAFLHIVRHSRCQSLTYRLERISRTGCPERFSEKI